MIPTFCKVGFLLIGLLILLVTSQSDDCTQVGDLCISSGSGSGARSPGGGTPPDDGDEDCDEKEDICVPKETPVQMSFMRQGSGPDSGSDGPSGGRPGGGRPSRARTTTERRADSQFRRLERVFPDISTLSDDNDRELAIKRDIPSSRAHVGQCHRLEGLGVLRPSARTTARHSTPREESCRESCFWYYPVKVRSNGVWHWVYQSRSFHQSLRLCSCLNPFCYGRSHCGFWWAGTCVPEKARKTFLVYYYTSLGRLRFKFVTIRYTAGCCCVPWGYH